MLSNTQFNDLQWIDMIENDLEVMEGARIDSIEPIWTRLWSSNGAAVISGVVLYLTTREGTKIAVSLDTPDNEDPNQKLGICKAIIEEVEE